VCPTHSPSVVFIFEFTIESIKELGGAPHSLHSWEDFSTIYLHRCLILKKVDEYNHTSNVI